MSKRKGAIIFTHTQTEGACSFGRALMDKGWRISSRNVPRYGVKDIDPLRPDLLVVMGGPIGVYQADDFPFLKDEIAIIKARIDAGLPTLGICLGSQLMAAALGADVYVGSAGKELGWAPLTLNDNGKDHAIRHLCKSHTDMFHWHGDTFDLPQGATLLASSEKYPNQIYSYGENALGLQCHPEVAAPQLEEWLVTHHCDVKSAGSGLNIHDLRAEIAEKIDTLNSQAHKFFDDWLAQVGLAEQV